MATTFGFFNSQNGDRTYNAEQIGDMFEGLVSQGVYDTVGDGFVVQPSSGLTISIGSGRAVVVDKWINNDAAVTMTLNPAHVTLNRYTAIVLRLNLENREITLEMVDGANSTSPVKPTLTRTSVIYEICLAYIYVAGGATSITTTNITDTRWDSNLCGYVKLLPNPSIERTWADYTVGSNGTSYVNLPSQLNYRDGDILDVYVGGILLSPNEYTMMTNEVENVPMIKVTNGLEKGNVVTFLCTKAVQGDEEFMTYVDSINGEVI